MNVSNNNQRNYELTGAVNNQGYNLSFNNVNQNPSKGFNNYPPYNGPNYPSNNVVNNPSPLNYTHPPPLSYNNPPPPLNYAPPPLNYPPPPPLNYAPPRNNKSIPFTHIHKSYKYEKRSIKFYNNKWTSNANSATITFLS